MEKQKLLQYIRLELLSLTKMKKLRKNKGMGLVEIIIGAAIITTGILAIIVSYTTYVEYALSNQKNVESAFVLEEGLEVMTFLRDDSWTSNIFPLISGTSYYLHWNGTDWSATTTPQYVDGMLRKIIVGNVFRDGSDKIAASGTLDPDTKKVTSTVDLWQGHGTTTSSISTYITNLYSN